MSKMTKARKLQKDHYKQENCDAVLSVRCKATTLATIARYFMENGMFVVNRSTLIRTSLETLEEHLIRDKKAVPYTSISEARDFLARGGIRNLNPGGKLGQTFLEEGEREANTLDEQSGSDPDNLEPWQREAIDKIKQERESTKTEK